MLLQCQTKGCYLEDEHQLDTSTNEVYCTKCNNTINVPATTKKVLKNMGQIRRTAKSGIQNKCKKCGHTNKPVLKKLSGQVYTALCRACKSQLDIHQSFIMAMVEMGAEYMEEEKREPTKATPTRSLLVDE